MMPMVLMAVGGLLGLVGWIWIVVHAFQKSVWWGLGSLLISPVSLIFALIHFGENKKQLLITLAGTVLYVAGLVPFLGQMKEMQEQMQEQEQQQQQPMAPPPP